MSIVAEALRVGEMPYWDAGLWLLQHCHHDPVTVRNVREMVPSIRASGMIEPAELDAAVAAFEQRVQAASLPGAA
jgi:hypothetical protein